MNQYQELAQKLKPYIIQWKLQTSTTNVVTTTTTPTSINWSAINFAGSSLTDIVNRPHSALSGLLSDDHTQYVRQTGRSGTADIDVALRVRNSTSTNYRFAVAAYSTGTAVNSYDDTGAVYTPLSLQGSRIDLQPDANNGLTIATNSIWYSGITQINTDNYASQTTGMHLGYDGSIDCQYLYTNQLHAKAFIADLEQALAGAQIITKSVTILDQTFTASYPGSSTTLTVKDLPSAHGMQVFQANDYIRLRQFARSGGSLNIADCWGQVTAPVDNGNGTQSWTFTRSGTSTNNTITQVANYSAASVSGTSQAITKPIGTASGDFIVVGISTPTAIGITPGSGFAQQAQYSGSGVTLTIFQKIAGGSEPASYTFTFASSTAYGVSAVTYRNVYSIAYTNSQANASSTSMAAPGGIPGSSNDMYIMFGGVAGNVRATPPAGLTERLDIGATGIGIYAADKLLSSNANPGTQTATLASSAASVTISLLITPTWSSLSSTAGQMYPYTPVAADAIVLDYGVSGNGYAEVTTVDGNYGANSPYYQIVTWTTHPATGGTVKMRLGNLTGITDTSFSSFSGKYGLYTNDTYLKGDLETGGGYIRMYQSSGINIQQDVWGSWDDKRALQWWPDITSMSGDPSLAMYTGKDTGGGFTANQNFAYIDSNPTGNVAAALTLSAFGQGTGTDAGILLQGGSQAGTFGSSITAVADEITLSAPTSISGTIKTTLGSTWDLGAYTTTAPAATGYVTIKIGGTTYKLLAST